MIEEILYAISPASEAEGMYEKANYRYSIAEEEGSGKKMEYYREARRLFKALIKFWSEYFSETEIDEMKQNVEGIELIIKKMGGRNE